MNKLKFLPFLVLSIFLSSCFVIEMSVYIKKNNKCDVEMKYDLSRFMKMTLQMMSKMSEKGEAQIKRTENIDTTLVLKGMSDEEKINALKSYNKNTPAEVNPRGLKYLEKVNIKSKIDDKDTVHVLKYYFADVPVEELPYVMNDTSSVLVEKENGNYSIKFLAVQKGKRRMRGDDEMLKKMFEGSYFLLKIKSDKKIVSHNAQKKEKSELIWKFPFDEIMKKAGEANNVLVDLKIGD